MFFFKLEIPVMCCCDRVVDVATDTAGLVPAGHVAETTSLLLQENRLWFVVEFFLYVEIICCFPFIILQGIWHLFLPKVV